MRKEKENSSDNPYQYSLKQNLEDAGCSDEMDTTIYGTSGQRRRRKTIAPSLWP